MCVITAGIKNYKSINEKSKRTHDKRISLAKSKWNSLEVLISNALIHSNIIHDEFVLTNNVPKKFCDMKEEINFKNQL